MLIEAEHYESEIRAFTREDLLDAGPIEVEGQDYAIVADAIATGEVYLVDVEVRLAGGEGEALALGDDYTVNLRTGVIGVVEAGALDGQASAWVKLSYEGVDNVALRQLASRAAYLKAQIDALLATLVSAGNGLTGGGNLSADRTLSVQAADGSIEVVSGGVRVGVINDTRHGDRGGGSLHANATTSVAGFLSATDKTKLDRVANDGAPNAIAPVITGSNNNYDPPGWGTADIVVVSGSAGPTLTGLRAPSAGERHWKVLVVTGSNTVTLANESASSSSANRILLEGATNDVIGVGGARLLVYADAKWRVVGLN